MLYVLHHVNCITSHLIANLTYFNPVQGTKNVNKTISQHRNSFLVPIFIYVMSQVRRGDRGATGKVLGSLRTGLLPLTSRRREFKSPRRHTHGEIRWESKQVPRDMTLQWALLPDSHVEGQTRSH